MTDTRKSSDYPRKYSARIYIMVSDLIRFRLGCYGGEMSINNEAKMALLYMCRDFDALFIEDSERYKPKLFREACGFATEDWGMAYA